MSLKDEIELAKKSLSGDEKILENVFKVEKTYNKHKKKIWIIVALIVLFALAKWFMSYEDAKNMKAGNEALITLEKSPDDKDALEVLKNSSPKLYELRSYSQAVKNSDKEALQKLTSSSDELIADLSTYHIGVLNGEPQDSKYYSDLSALQAAYSAIESKDYSTAKEKLTQIDEKSPVAEVANKLRHFLAGK